MKQEKTETLLQHLQEELAEVIQAVSKTARFGPEDFWPERGMSNRQYLSKELGNAAAIVNELIDRHVILPFYVKEGEADKKGRMNNWGGDLYDFSKWDESYFEEQKILEARENALKGPSEL